jgi:hypothetical protein
MTDPAALLTRLEQAKQSGDVWQIEMAGQALESAAPALAAEVIRLRAYNARLREGLQPFANVDPEHVRSGIWHHHDEHSALILTAEHFEQARAALKGGEI